MHRRIQIKKVKRLRSYNKRKILNLISRNGNYKSLFDLLPDEIVHFVTHLENVHDIRICFNIN